MLRCPRCLGPVTVTHCHCRESPRAESQSGTEHQSDSVTSMYQNLGVMLPPGPEDQLLRRLEDVREGDRRIQEDLQTLQIRLLQSQLQHAQLQQEMLLRGQKLPPSASPAAEFLPSLDVSPSPGSSCSLSSSALSPLDSEIVLLNSRQEMSQCGWYYGQLSWQQSQALLQFSEDGTFLVRDSQDPRFTYTLSLARAKEGPTSVRIYFSRGKFSLDADDRIRHLMPRFSSVGTLISYYAALDSGDSGDSEDSAPRKSEAPPWPGPWGSLSSHRLCVRRPLLRAPPSLAHCARLAINKNIHHSAEDKFSKKYVCDTRQLPPKLLEYLGNYKLCI